MNRAVELIGPPLTGGVGGEGGGWNGGGGVKTGEGWWEGRNGEGRGDDLLLMVPVVGAGLPVTRPAYCAFSP